MNVGLQVCARRPSRLRDVDTSIRRRQGNAAQTLHQPSQIADTANTDYLYHTLTAHLELQLIRKVNYYFTVPVAGQGLHPGAVCAPRARFSNRKVVRRPTRCAARPAGVLERNISPSTTWQQHATRRNSPALRASVQFHKPGSMFGFHGSFVVVPASGLCSEFASSQAPEKTVPGYPQALYWKEHPMAGALAQ